MPRQMTATGPRPGKRAAQAEESRLGDLNKKNAARAARETQIAGEEAAQLNLAEAAVQAVDDYNAVERLDPRQHPALNAAVRQARKVATILGTSDASAALDSRAGQDMREIKDEMSDVWNPQYPDDMIQSVGEQQMAKVSPEQYDPNNPHGNMPAANKTPSAANPNPAPPVPSGANPMPEPSE